MRTTIGAETTTGITIGTMAGTPAIIQLTDQARTDIMDAPGTDIIPMVGA